MNAKVLEGTKVAEDIDKKLVGRIKTLRLKDVVPTLAILRVGERAEDISYEIGATKRAESVGIAVKKIVFPTEVSQDELQDAVRTVNANDDIHGLLMFRPLPDHIDEELVVDALAVQKDVDSSTKASLASVFTGSAAGFAPCTAQACIEILDHYRIDIEGKNIVVVGRSLVVGKPVAQMLLNRNATVTMAHSRTKNLPEITKASDIIITCVGRAHMLDKNYFSSGQTVIDVGINLLNNQIVGDAVFDEVSNIVDAITPVPRGVGSVTTSVLCKHVVEAAEAAKAVGAD